MRKVILGILSMMIMGSVLFAGENIPEFDGGYILTTDGNLIEVHEQKYKEQYWTTVLIDKKNNRAFSPSMMVRMAKNPWSYCVDISKAPEIEQSKFKGFYLKGRYDYSLFGFAKLDKLKLSQIGLFENKGPAKEGETIYITKWPSHKVDWREKTINSNLSYYKPKVKFEKGLYVAWPGSFFVFKII